MRNGSRGGGRLRFLGVSAAIAVVLPLLVAYHWARLGWRDEHQNYPSRPSGYTQIVNRFGQPCSAEARAIPMRWRAADNGTTYSFTFHRKLGGRPTAMVSDEGGRSTNLDNDVYGHIQNAHLQPYVEHGIYGYACRAKRNSNEWSTHAFGIAIDVSSAEEYMGKCTSTVNKNHASIWKDHGWHWGLSFCDPMHFQFATDF
ncbi:MAG TPA: M15 family metallopeptidase [Actinomycetota bacterium]|nr:M15 family metallopeptidase [Actinomycetota bacterium]